jgi:Cft2 family RNA processing exonuclease
MITPTFLMSKLQELMTKLESINKDLIEADKELTDAKIVFDFMEAKVTSEVTGKTVMEKTAQIHLAVESEYNDLMHAQEHMRSVKVRADQIKLEIEVHRSMSSLIKAELALTGMMD